MWIEILTVIILVVNIIYCNDINNHVTLSKTNERFLDYHQHQHHQLQPTTNLTCSNDVGDNRNCDAEHNIDLFKRKFSKLHINNNNLISSSVIYGILALSTRNDLNELCYNETQLLLNDIHNKEIWAMKVFDASGTSQSGFLWGNNFWMGSIKGCQAANEPITLTISNRYPRHMKSNLIYTKTPFPVDYRIVYAKHRSPWQIQVEFFLSWKILHIGLCLPKSCSDIEIHTLTQKYFDSNLMDAHRMYEHQSEIVAVKNLELKTNFLHKNSVQIIGIFTLLTLVLGLLSYVYDNYFINKYSRNIFNKKIETCHKNVIQENEQNIIDVPSLKHISQSNDHNFNNNNDIKLNYNDNSKDILTKLNTNNINNYLEINKALVKEENLFINIIKCFSISDNLKYILSTDDGSNVDAIPLISGLKSVSCFLILIFHLHWYMYYTVDNSAIMFAYGEKILYAWVGTNPILVDLFFTISGLLLSYNFLKKNNKSDEVKNNNLWQNLKLYAKQLLHRYLRLSPVYLIIVGLSEISVSYIIETSPFYVVERYDKLCRNYWWRNVLYIQNLFDVKDLCANWTWSMACEMQFFAVFTLLLFLYAKHPFKAKTIFIISFIGFSILGLFITYKVQFTAAYDVMHNLGNEVYIAPWSRVVPYMVGVGAGYILHITNRQMNLNKKLIKLLWTISITIIITTHYSTYDRGVPYQYAAPLMACIRILYSSSIAWIILSTAMGYNIWIVGIFNHRIFTHLNKLTYTIYLLNPLLILVVFGLKDHSTHIQPLTTSITTLGIMLIVYALSIVFTLLYEVPYIKLSNVMLKAKQKQA